MFLKSLLAAILLSLTPTAALRAETTEKIRVGVIIPLTGEFAAWGEGIRRSIELYASSPTAKFTFDFEDEGSCEPQKSVTGFRRLMTSQVHFVVLGCLSGTKAILPIAKREKVALFSVGLLDDSTFAESSQIVNLATQLSTESAYLAKEVARLASKRVAIIHWVDSFSEEFARTLHEALRKLDIVVAAKEGVDPKDSDFRSLLVKILALKPDAICFNVGQDQQAVLLKQIEASGFKGTIYSNYVFETPSVLALGKFAEGVRYTFPLNSSENSAALEEFDRQFRTKYGPTTSPTPNSYFVRDGLTLLERALAECKSADPVCAIEYPEEAVEFYRAVGSNFISSRWGATIDRTESNQSQGGSSCGATARVNCLSIVPKNQLRKILPKAGAIRKFRR